LSKTYRYKNQFSEQKATTSEEAAKAGAKEGAWYVSFIKWFFAVVSNDELIDR